MRAEHIHRLRRLQIFGQDGTKEYLRAVCGKSADMFILRNLRMVLLLPGYSLRGQAGKDACAPINLSKRLD
jgi:hypothetical protein